MHSSIGSLNTKLVYFSSAPFATFSVIEYVQSSASERTVLFVTFVSSASDTVFLGPSTVVVTWFVVLVLESIVVFAVLFSVTTFFVSS